MPPPRGSIEFSEDEIPIAKFAEIDKKEIDNAIRRGNERGDIQFPARVENSQSYAYRILRETWNVVWPKFGDTFEGYELQSQALAYIKSRAPEQPLHRDANGDEHYYTIIVPLSESEKEAGGTEFADGTVYAPIRGIAYYFNGDELHRGMEHKGERVRIFASYVLADRKIDDYNVFVEEGDVVGSSNMEESDEEEGDEEENEEESDDDIDIDFQKYAALEGSKKYDSLYNAFWNSIRLTEANMNKMSHERYVYRKEEAERLFKLHADKLLRRHERALQKENNENPLPQMQELEIGGEEEEEGDEEEGEEEAPVVESIPDDQFVINLSIPHSRDKPDKRTQERYVHTITSGEEIGNIVSFEEDGRLPDVYDKIMSHDAPCMYCNRELIPTSIDFVRLWHCGHKAHRTCLRRLCVDSNQVECGVEECPTFITQRDVDDVADFRKMDADYQPGEDDIPVPKREVTIELKNYLSHIADTREGVTIQVDHDRIGKRGQRLRPVVTGATINFFVEDDVVNELCSIMDVNKGVIVTIHEDGSITLKLSFSENGLPSLPSCYTHLRRVLEIVSYVFDGAERVCNLRLLNAFWFYTFGDPDQAILEDIYDVAEEEIDEEFDDDEDDITAENKLPDAMDDKEGSEVLDKSKFDEEDLANLRKMKPRKFKTYFLEKYDVNPDANDEKTLRAIADIEKAREEKKIRKKRKKKLKDFSDVYTQQIPEKMRKQFDYLTMKMMFQAEERKKKQEHFDEDDTEEEEETQSEAKEEATLEELSTRYHFAVLQNEMADAGIPPFVHIELPPKPKYLIPLPKKYVVYDDDDDNETFAKPETEEGNVQAIDVGSLVRKKGNTSSSKNGNVNTTIPPKISSSSGISPYDPSVPTTGKVIQSITPGNKEKKKSRKWRQSSSLAQPESYNSEAEELKRQRDMERNLEGFRDMIASVTTDSKSASQTINESSDEDNSGDDSGGQSSGGEGEEDTKKKRRKQPESTNPETQHPKGRGDGAKARMKRRAIVLRKNAEARKKSQRELSADIVSSLSSSEGDPVELLRGFAHEFSPQEEPAVASMSNGGGVDEGVDYDEAPGEDMPESDDDIFSVHEDGSSQNPYTISSDNEEENTDGYNTRSVIQGEGENEEEIPDGYNTQLVIQGEGETLYTSAHFDDAAIDNVDMENLQEFLLDLYEKQTGRPSEIFQGHELEQIVLADDAPVYLHVTNGGDFELLKNLPILTIIPQKKRAKQGTITIKEPKKSRNDDEPQQNHVVNKFKYGTLPEKQSDGYYATLEMETNDDDRGKLRMRAFYQNYSGANVTEQDLKEAMLHLFDGPRDKFVGMFPVKLYMKESGLSTLLYIRNNGSIMIAPDAPSVSLTYPAKRKKNQMEKPKGRKWVRINTADVKAYIRVPVHFKVMKHMENREDMKVIVNTIIDKYFDVIGGIGYDDTFDRSMQEFPSLEDIEDESQYVVYTVTSGPKVTQSRDMPKFVDKGGFELHYYSDIDVLEV